MACSVLPGVTVSFVAMAAQQETGRNGPCPCGSGRKYKHCCLRLQPVAEDTLWSRQHEAYQQLTSAMMSYAQERFREEVHEAWLDFHLGDDGGVAFDSDELMIFMPYFLFHWDPESSGLKKKPLEGGVVVRSFLRDRGYTLSELQRTMLEQNITRPFSFYLVLASTPGEGLALADVLTGARVEVVERMASKTLKAGDIMYGAVCALPGISVLGCCAPIAIPPQLMADIIKLRKKLRRKIAKQKRELAEQDLVRYADDIRETYVDVRDSLHRPPQFANTDGDRLQFHTMTFQIKSPEAAFRALARLAAVTQSPEDLLNDAEFGRDGTMRRVEIPWVKKGNRKMATWDNTILGRIQIDGNSLVAEVNSVQRAERLRAEIDKRLGAAAVHQSTVIVTQEEMMRNAKKREPKAGTDDDAGAAILRDPEARRQAQEFMQKEVEAWVGRKLPVLGGRTPLQAVNDPDGREIVQSLLIGWERQMKSQPGGLQPDMSAVRRLLNLYPPTTD